MIPDPLAGAAGEFADAAIRHGGVKDAVSRLRSPVVAAVGPARAVRRLLGRRANLEAVGVRHAARIVHALLPGAIVHDAVVEGPRQSEAVVVPRIERQATLAVAPRVAFRN